MKHSLATRLTVVAVAAIALVSCGTWSSDDGVSGGSPPPGSATANPFTGIVPQVDVYRATEWLDNGSVATFIPNATVQISFANNGRFSAQTGCGTVSGDYDIGEGQLVLTNVSWGHTLLDTAFCVADGMRQDARIATFVQSRPDYSKIGDTLTLASPSMTLTFAAQR